MSSPGTYMRCSAKSTDAPKYGDRCMPLMKPSTTLRATSSRLPMRERTTGSTNRAPGIADVPIISYPLSAYSLARWLHARPWHRHGLEQPIDERVGRDRFGLRVEVREHAVPEDWMRHRPDVLEA